MWQWSEIEGRQPDYAIGGHLEAFIPRIAFPSGDVAGVT